MDKKILIINIVGWIFLFSSIPIIWLGYKQEYLYKIGYVFSAFLWYIIGIYIVLTTSTKLMEEEIILQRKIKAIIIINFEYILFLISITLLYAFLLHFFYGEIKEYYAIVIAGITGAFWSWGILEMKEKIKEIRNKTNRQVQSEEFRKNMKKGLFSSIFWFIFFIVEMIVITILIYS